MRGKRYSEIIQKLVAKGSWRVGDTEEGFTELYKFGKEETEVLEISYSGGIITGVYKYTY